ncbi:hypothetical protein LCGC14_1969690 [marine sediment metagenome]|uniref:Uncharacterized protein n=1 Tax=marine sediment metagenome TaxID=412755 RepID=A0A0F9HQH3_9ZZZZ
MEGIIIMELILLGIAVGLVSASFFYYPVRWIAWFMNEYTSVYPYCVNTSYCSDRVKEKVYQWTYRVVAGLTVFGAWYQW